MPFGAQLLNERDDDKAVEHRDAGQRDEPNARADRERDTGDQQRRDAAGQRHRHAAEYQQRVCDGAEAHEKQKENQQQRDRHYDGQALRRRVDIPNANERTFLPGNAQGGQMLRIVASYTDDLGTAETVMSAATAPVLNIEGPPLGISLDNFFVFENIAPGEVVAQVTVDDDIGDTHTFVVSDPRFEIVGGQLRLAAGASLDDPDVGFLSLTITVTDQLGYSADFPVGLVILNVNETPTRIVLDPAVVSENALGGVVGTVTVLDPDFGDVHAFTLSDARFEVVDGVLKLRDDQSLNFETEPTLTVSVTATDQLGLSTTSDFTILVADLNDSTPTITGTNVANTLNGTAGDDHIAGLGGNDTLNGLGGNDILDGGTGADTIAGGAGNDIYIVDTATDTVTENAGAGNDTVKTGLSAYTLGANVENLIYTGAGTFNGTGNGLANAIAGGNASDTIGGGGGIDLLIGNGGNDSLNGNGGDDAIYGGAGNDTLTGEAG